MKKTSLMILAMLFIAANIAVAQSESDEAYIKAMSQNDPCQKYQLLKSFVTKYAGKGSQYEGFAYAYLCLTPCGSKPAAESIQYGEKAFAMPGIDDITKSQLYITVASLYIGQGQNLDKAKSHAGRLIELAKANRDKDPSDAQWNKLVGAGHYIQGQAMEKAKDIAGAADAYIASYAILKDPKIIKQLKKLAKGLYDAKQFAEAEKVFRSLYNQSKDPESALILGQTLYKNGKPEEALALFKEAYAKKKTGGLAYNIGIILAKKSPQEAIDYLLEASYLDPAQAAQAQGMAQSLFFSSSSDAKLNDVIGKIEERNKKIEELTKSFNTKFEGRNEEDLTEAEKADMQKILADIEAQKKEIEKLQNSSTEMTSRWTKRMNDVKARLGK